MSINGALASFGSTSQVIIGKAGQASSAGNISWTGELTAALNASGAGGLDTGSEAANTWYAVYAIGDSSGSNNPAALFSASFSSPSLPSGYDQQALVWAVKNDGSSEIIKFYQSGKGSKRRCWYDYGTNNLRVVDAGNSTAWAQVDCSAYAPPVVDLVHLQVKFETGTKGAATDDVRVRRNGASSSQAAPAVGVKSGDSAAFQIPMICDDDQKLEYKVDNSKNKTTIVVRGWDLDL
jgi:hypothetical protein